MSVHHETPASCPDMIMSVLAWFFLDPDLSIIVENSNGNDYKITFTEYEKNELINKRPKNHNKTSVLSVRWGFSPGDEYLNQYRV